MKTIILAGGFGKRLAEQTDVRPKPMVEIGGKPILWHIMKIYSSHGINDFIICCGYKGYVIKEYFNNYFLHMSDITFDIENNNMTVHRGTAEPWRVTLVDTSKRQVKVEGVRVVKRHQKPVGEQPGGIIHKEAFIDVSNVAYWDAENERRIKVGYAVVDGKKVRVDRKTGSALDKE